MPPASCCSFHAPMLHEMGSTLLLDSLHRTAHLCIVDAHITKVGAPSTCHPPAAARPPAGCAAPSAEPHCTAAGPPRCMCAAVSHQAGCAAPPRQLAGQLSLTHTAVPAAAASVDRLSALIATPASAGQEAAGHSACGAGCSGGRCAGTVCCACGLHHAQSNQTAFLCRHYLGGVVKPPTP